MFYFWVWLSLACWFGAVCVAWWITTLRSARFMRRSSPGMKHERPVIILRPCAGAERGLHHLLASSGSVVCTRDFLLRFAVATPVDRAFPIAQEAASELRAQGLDADVVLTGGGGPNRKVAQLAAALREPMRPDSLIVVVDSDVDLTGFELDVMLDQLEDDPGLGLVWAPPVDAGPVSSLGDRGARAVLSGSFHAFPLLCGIDPSAVVGKTIALRAEVLDATGGFDGLIEFLGEDIELSRRVRGLGLRVEPASVTVASCSSKRSLASVIARISRWMQVIRAQRPWLMPSYPLFFFAGSVLVIFGTALASIAHGWPSQAGAALALCALLTRVGLSFVARRRCGQNVSMIGAVIDAVLGDLVLAFAFVRACCSRRFQWRGVGLQIGRDGRLLADDS